MKPELRLKAVMAQAAKNRLSPDCQELLVEHFNAAIMEEREECMRDVCEQCRQGTPYYCTTGLHRGNLECKAAKIRQRSVDMET